MRKVFGILCHRVTNPLLFTIHYLSSFADNHIVIHVDRKADIAPFGNLASSNVHFVKNRVTIQWGAFSQVESTVNLLNEAKEIGFDYFFLISGDDLPCKTNEEMDAFLAANDYKNIVHFDHRETGLREGIERVKYDYPDFFFAKNKSFISKIKSKLFKALRERHIAGTFSQHGHKVAKFYKGSNWISLNWLSAEKMLAFIASNPWYVDMYRRSLCGDEVFFHTALRLAGVEDFLLRENQSSHDFRYIDWNRGPDYPRTLDESDLTRIKSTQDLFARKFPADLEKAVFLKLIGSVE